MRAAGQQMGFYIIYLYTPPATDANAFSSITGMCVHGGIIFHSTLHSQAMQSLQTKQLYCGGEHPGFFFLLVFFFVTGLLQKNAPACAEY